ncbi:MAG: PEP-CTERM sorting domain-containing protein [Proteobacteria bacterium]|nr:PEP-CTERM sorting domain-containing protein [Pseudomonadota bacterium]
MTHAFSLQTTIRHDGSHASGWGWLAGMATAALASLPGTADAGFVQPTGVSAYRLMFVTSGTRDAQDTSFAPYDLFATTQAALAGDLPSATWQAVVSVAVLGVGYVSAATHIACATCDATVPIFMVDGTQVATSTNAMFAGTFVTFPNQTQTGTVVPGGSYVWTGSNEDGTVARPLGDNEPTFGGVGIVGHIFNYGSSSKVNHYSFYAISDTIFVPEPATGLAVLGGGVAVTRVLRRRRAQRRAA